MKFLIKIYFENRKLKKKVQQLEKENQYMFSIYDRFFISGCTHCIHGMYNDDLSLCCCELTQKNLCNKFIRKD